jgi:hypothetical protein
LPSRLSIFSEGTVVNAVNMPSVTGEVLEKIGPYLTLADRMGCLQAQLVRGPLRRWSLNFMVTSKTWIFTRVNGSAQGIVDAGGQGRC